MFKKTDNHLGIMFRREHPAEQLPEFARRAEKVGFDELWVVEDCCYGSGIASAASALASTDTIVVGLGIMPVVVRNPVFTAMEIATLSRIYPGRFLPGLGHGMAGWMHQIGAYPGSQLKALQEVTCSIKRLLAGERLSVDGDHVQLDEVQLVFPPDQVPPISLGVRGPKSLAISGKVADGTILAEFTSPAYISWAREQIMSGLQEIGISNDHRLTVFSLACAGQTTGSARDQLRPLIASAILSGKIDSQLAPMGILTDVHELLESCDQSNFAKMMPDAWIDQLSILGTPADWKLTM